MTPEQQATYDVIAAAYDRAARASTVVESRFAVWVAEDKLLIFCPSCGALRSFVEPIRRVPGNDYPVFLHASACCPILQELRAAQQRALLNATCDDDLGFLP